MQKKVEEWKNGSGNVMDEMRAFEERNEGKIELKRPRRFNVSCTSWNS